MRQAVLEGHVHLGLLDEGPAAHEEMAHVFRQVVAQGVLHRQPVLLIKRLLLIGQDAHEQIVADQVSLGELVAFEVEAFEHQIGVIGRGQGDRDQRQPVHGRA